MQRLTSAEAKEFKKRWSAITAAEVAELRATSKAQKLRQLIALMSSAEKFGWREPSMFERNEIAARWQRLRRMARG